MTERRELEAGGWELVEDQGKYRWRHPKSGYLYSQELAIKRLREDERDKKDTGFEWWRD